MKFKDKVVLVTGSSRGIGKATILAFAKEGAKVVINYKISKDLAENIVKKIGQNAISIQADVSKEKEVINLIDQTIEKFGKLDILVNNAGEISSRGFDVSYEDWINTININLTSAYFVTKYSIPYLKKSKNSNIVFLSSFVGELATAQVLAYSVAKAAIPNLTKSYAKLLAPDIRVNAVSPGNIDSDMGKGAGEDFKKYVIETTPMKRLGLPKELANAVLFLASDQASFITGEILHVDGGYALNH